MLRGIGNPYVKGLDSKSDLPDFVFLPYISFILAFRALVCI